MPAASAEPGPVKLKKMTGYTTAAVMPERRKSYQSMNVPMLDATATFVSSLPLGGIATCPVAIHHSEAADHS